MRIQLTRTLEIGHDSVKNVELTASFRHDGRIDPSEVFEAIAQALAPEETPKSAIAALVGSTWKPPADLHGKARNTVHRAIVTLDKAGGKGLTVQELHERSGLSLVPLYNMLKEGTVGEYASRHIHVTKLGRSQVLDLTAEGRRLASLIRAGKVPS